MSFSGSVKAALQMTMCEGTIWRVHEVNSLESSGELEILLRASEIRMAALRGGPGAVLERLTIRSFKREARILELEREVELLNAKLDGVMIGNGSDPKSREGRP